MKRLGISVLAVALSIGLLPLESAEAGPNSRIRRTQVKQAKRIRNGVRNGSLTRRESRKLVNQQKRIQRARRKALSNDGKIDRKERNRLRFNQAKASRQIFKEKHDGQGTQMDVANTRRARISRTQARQAGRIVDGVQDGELTRRETKNLVRMEKKIQKAKRKAMANDGKIDRQEAKRIRLMQAKASGRIYREKHDDQTQN